MRVYAVEDTTVQVVWRTLPAPAGTIGVGPRSVRVEGAPQAWARFRVRGTRRVAPGATGPGGVVVEGLEPGRSYPLWWRPDAGSRVELGSVRTLLPPPGRLLARFATVSDLHLGERAFGASNAIEDVAPAGAPPYPARALQAALAEARAWGAEAVVAKGDLTERARPAEFAAAGRLLAGSGMRAFAQLGNHDRRAGAGPGPHLGGVPVAEDGLPLVVDLPGVRLVLADTPSPHDRRGHLADEQIARIEAAAVETTLPTVVSVHHPPERWAVPTSYPPGIVQPDSRRLMDALARSGVALVVAGHTHRNRTYRIRGVPVAEVGSTKDHPGGWAGYAVHEGGLRQLVRRTTRPDVIAWTDATAQALGGVWGWWSPGRLADRCWSLPWPV